MALWSNKTVQVPGLTATYASSGPITAESRRHYILDTTSNTITVNLPSGIDGYSIRISDAKGTFLTNNVIVVPSTGQKINNLTINESLLLDVNEMWIELTWNALAGSWILNAPGVLGLIADSFSDYPYITSPASPAASTLRLYAKSDGKLYTKDSAGSEQKVGGGLDHPTTGSTFEGGIANPSMTGTSNTAIGVTAADSLTTGYDNVAIGTDAMTLMTDGNSNVAIGKNALNQNTSGYFNVAIGLNAGDQFVSDANSNTIINTPGAAGTSLTYSGVVAIGRDNLGGFAAATASNQFVLGTSNHRYRFPGIAQTSLVLGPTGTSTGQTGVIRVRELAANGTNSVGFRAADSIAADVTWTLPAADGTNGQALITNGSGTLSWSTSSGLAHPTTGSTFEGGTANPSMTGTSNTAIGVNAGNSIINASSGTFIGADAGTSVTTGNNNTAVGQLALLNTQTGFNNVAVGAGSFFNITDGANNVGIGSYSAQSFLGSSSFNTIIGTSGSATAMTRSGTVAIGRDSTGNEALVTADNEFVLGTSSHLYRFPGVVQTSLVLGPTGTSTGQTGTLQLRELAASGSNLVALRAPDALASDVTLTLPTSAGTNGQLLTTDGTGILSWSTVSASNSTILVTQNSHGFVAADIGRPLYLNGSTYTFAQADTEAKAEVAGIINSIVDTNNFRLCLAGEVSSVGANLIVGGGALTPGEMYFLSASDTGKISVTPPSVVGQISKPVGIARTSSALDFFNMRGSAVGGTNVYTQIGLTNNAVTTIQNAAAYDSVELSGWVYINATTPLRFAIKVQVTKNGAGNNYLTSFQTSGDTPPSGFDVDATAAGLVQVTLPSIAGFTSSVVQFSLNGPAVGASLPLQIQSSLITVNAGIQFPATMIPSADPNNLDDYEENVWVPSIYGGSTAGTWTPNATQTGGYYIKIGKLVYLFINLNGTLAGAAGALLIGNLPFPRSTPNAANGWNATYSAFTMAYGNGLTWTAGHYCAGWLADPNNFLYGHTMPTGGGVAGTIQVTNAALNIHITGAYYTN